MKEEKPSDYQGASTDLNQVPVGELSKADIEEIRTFVDAVHSGSESEMLSHWGDHTEHTHGY